MERMCSQISLSPQQANIQRRFPTIFDQLARFIDSHSRQPELPPPPIADNTLLIAIHNTEHEPFPASLQGGSKAPSPLSDNDTLQDNLITYLCTQSVNEATLQHFWDFCTTEALDEEALIQDIITPQQSNIHKAFPAIFDQLARFVTQQNHLLLHTLRQATHQYHYIRMIDKQPKLCVFDKASPLDTTAYRLVQISCQTEAQHSH